MVWKWIKDNIIGDLAEERSKYQAEQTKQAEAWKELNTRVFSTRDFDLEIVGESNYQDALRRSKREAKDYGGRAYITAIVVREPDNKFDSAAVKVMNGRLETIGYLRREVAATYGESIELWETEGYSLRCEAVLVGGTGTRESIGAWLDFASPDTLKLTFQEVQSRS